MEIIIQGEVASVSIGGGNRKLTEGFSFVIDGLKSTIPSGFIWDGAFIIITLLIFALIFGALGERGFHAVTDRIPLPSADPIAAHNDFDKYTNHNNKGKTKC